MTAATAFKLQNKRSAKKLTLATLKNRNQEIRELVDTASGVIAPAWPLETFIANNPLNGLEHLRFENAIDFAHNLFESKEVPAEMEAVNRTTIKWCLAFFDQGQAVLPMPYRHLGLYRAWLKLVPYDSSAYFQTDWLHQLPEDSTEAVAYFLGFLGATHAQEIALIQQSLAALPGWAGYVKYREQWDEYNSHSVNPASMMDYVALRLALTCLLWPTAANDLRMANSEVATVKSRIDNAIAAESKNHEPLIQTLHQRASQTPVYRSKRSEAQLVFCIDVRSEPFRRQLEASGNYETLGFAGFFGVPVAFQHHGKSRATSCCPALLKPKHQLAFSHKPSVVKTCQQGWKAFYNSLKYQFATPFILAESIGIFAGLTMMIRTLLPLLGNSLYRSIAPLPPQRQTESFQENEEVLLCNFTLEEQISYCESALRLMGLTKNFAPLVVLCGHGSSTVNNPFASALDCGACGGNHGGGNARLLAAMLNNPQVRDALAKQEITIPHDTVFIGGQHDTTTHEVTLFSHNSHFSTVEDKARLVELEDVLREIKLSQRDGLNPPEADWAQVRPEWGLARNQAFVIGPRILTKNLNLEGRCFLHSYDHMQDSDGTLLETILTAPMVVAQWINNHYLFTTLNNAVYGSGSKVTQNVAGKIGVMQGNASDLLTGLPLQSVYQDDKTPYHSAQRLLVVVYAPRERIEQIIMRQPVLQKLFNNGWVKLEIIDPSHN